MASPTYGSAYPSGAYWLSLIGGIFIVLGGLIYMALGAIFSFIPGFAAIAIGIGAVGLIIGIIVIIFGLRLKSDPGSAKISGVVILILSIISWFVALGGLFIGFLLALIGGILAIVWTAPAAPQPVYGMPVPPPPMTTGAPPPPPPGATGPQQKFCSHCGTANAATAQFCAKCGAPMG
jgi:hypothetical protein